MRRWCRIAVTSIPPPFVEEADWLLSLRQKAAKSTAVVHFPDLHMSDVEDSDESGSEGGGADEGPGEDDGDYDEEYDGDYDEDESYLD